MTKQILLSLLNCSWQWMLLGGLTWFITHLLFRKNRRSNTTVHLLCLLSLLSLPILFGLNQFVPALSIGGNAVPELARAAPINVSGLAAPVTDLSPVSAASSDTQTGNQFFTNGKSFFTWETETGLLLCVWAIGAFAMLVRFMFGLYRIHQLRRSAVVVTDDAYQSICRRLARQLNIKRSVRVCFSNRIASPISFGWLSPHILIPRELNVEQFELVAAHELAHVQRLDWLTNLFSHLVGVIFFFHPIYHLLNRELIRLRERICDDWVIQLTGARKNYAQCLLDLVRHEERTVPLALSLNQPSQLESRIDSILKSERPLDVQLKPRLRLIAATLLLTCLPLLAMAQLVPLKTFQVSLFAQTPQKSEKGVDKTEKKQAMEKAKAGKMDGKQYKDDSHIEVKAPTLFGQSEENSHDEKVKAGIIKEIEDTLGNAHDWLELRNLTDTELNLKGWTLDLATTKLDTERKVIQFNKDFKIPPDGIIIADTDMNLKGWIVADSVIIKEIEDADTEVNLKGWTLADRISIEDASSGDTYGWLELRNPTDTELNLKGWTLDLVTADLDTTDLFTTDLTKFATKGKLILFDKDVKIPAGGVLRLKIKK